MRRPAMVNIYDPDFDEPREHDGFRARRADGSGLKLYFRLDDAVDYDDGLTPPEVGDVDPA
jgi:hypothetical protein